MPLDSEQETSTPPASPGVGDSSSAGTLQPTSGATQADLGRGGAGLVRPWRASKIVASEGPDSIAPGIARGRALALALLVLTAGCGGGAPGEAPGGDPSPEGEAATFEETGSAIDPNPWFEDVTAASGVDFVHRSGFDGGFSMPEIMGSGLALFDIEGDGDLDLYLVDGAPWDDEDPATVEDPGAGGNRLYLNRGDGTFDDDTRRAGVGDSSYGMGCAVGDIDNDGDLDLYVTNLGADVFYRNRGDGTFEDATAAAGLATEGWSTSAGFFDADGDGDLDLFVARYVAWSSGQHCTTLAGQREYCGPLAFPGLSDRLYLNRGDGTFDDASDLAGLDRVARRGLGLALADLDEDGAIEIFVANDGEPNQLWDRQGFDADGRPRYEDRAVLMGVAVNLQGRSEASMGVAIGDVEGDGDLDLFATHLEQESNTLYLDAGGGFEDRSAGSGLGRSSLPTTGFGTVFFDGDLDGDLDLLVANGKVRLDVGAALAASSEAANTAPTTDGDRPLLAYAEPDHLFEQTGPGAFVSRPEPSLAPLQIGRGLAVGDLDGDGDLDVVISQTHAPPRILRNRAPRRGHWVRLRILDPDLGRAAVGARVEVEAGERRWLASVRHTESYLVGRGADLHFGLGETPAISTIQVDWPPSEAEPEGTRETFGPFETDRVLELVRGSGRREIP